jgi:hypothetical protein
VVFGATDRLSGTPESRTHAKLTSQQRGSNAPQRRTESPTPEITRTRDRRKLRDVALAVEGHRQGRVRGARDGTQQPGENADRRGGPWESVRRPGRMRSKLFVRR